jgi:glycosyltransferase involved in cell wall biosynthesis
VVTDRGAARPRILFLSARHPAPAWRGDQVRVLNLARALARDADVRLLSFGPADAEPISDLDARSLTPSLRGRLAANLRRPSPSTPGQVRLFLDRAMFAAVAEQISSWRPNVVHATLSRMAPYLPASGVAHRHLDLVDSLYLNMRERARNSGPPGRAAFSLEAALLKRYERSAAAAADSACAVSELDALAAGLTPEAVIPNGVDLDRFAFSDPAERPPVMIFFGNLGYFHNVEPARFLASEVLPRVRRRVPEAVLRIAGARPSASLRRAVEAGGAELIDSPADLIGELRRAAVAVLPMFSGSGIKNKVLEAFAVGLPVVANASGIEGIVGARAGEHYLLAEGADELAARAAELLVDASARSRVAAASRALVEANYSWDHQASRLLAMYDA